MEISRNELPPDAVSEIDKQLLATIKNIAAKGNKAEVEQGRNGLKVLEVQKSKVWEEN